MEGVGVLEVTVTVCYLFYNNSTNKLGKNMLVNTIQCQARDLFWLFKLMQVVSDQVGNCDSGWWGDSVIVGGEVTVRGVSDFEVSLTTYY
jgi:hypothetical protein